MVRVQGLFVAMTAIAAMAKELADMGVTRADIRVSADPVFTLSGTDADLARSLLTGHGVPLDKPLVCVSVRNWKHAPGLTEKVAQLCDNIVETLGRTVVLLPMQMPHDLDISREVASKMRCPSYVLDSLYSAEEMMGIIGLCDFVLAMRLHTLIFSARMCVPFIGIIYDPKVEAYIKAFSMPSAGRADSLSPEQAFKAVRAVVEQRGEYAESLRSLSSRYEALAYEDSRLLLSLLDAPKK
jgi:polysaccharide pyruvyl transferase WcaK-like protein